MSARKDIVAVGVNGSPMREIVAWLRRLGYRVMGAKTPDEARRIMMMAGPKVGALIIPPDLPTLNLRNAILSIRGDHAIPVLVTGRRPEVDVAEENSRLRSSGVDLALWTPLDESTLRFQVNRALATGGIPRRTRGALRAPANWRGEVSQGRRRKKAQIYTVSPGGAFLQLPNPSPRNAQVIVPVRAGGREVRLKARVTMTNVPGTFLRRNLPVGMGVVFEATSADIEAELLIYAMERLRSLDV